MYIRIQRLQLAVIVQLASLSLTRDYENTPMQYTAIFPVAKLDNFQLKNCDKFLIFAKKKKIVGTRKSRLNTTSLRRF